MLTPLANCTRLCTLHQQQEDARESQETALKQLSHWVPGMFAYLDDAAGTEELATGSSIAADCVGGAALCVPTVPAPMTFIARGLSWEIAA